jgi:hypothetical protein
MPGRTGVEAECFLGHRDCLVGLTVQHLQVGHFRKGIGLIGVYPQRRFELALRLVRLASVEPNISQRPMRHGIVRVDGYRRSGAGKPDSPVGIHLHAIVNRLAVV